MMTVQEAIERAERILPGVTVSDDQEDPRWEALVTVGRFAKAKPEQVWGFAEYWGQHKDRDLRAAIATCVLERLLEHHFEYLAERLEKLVQASSRFADTFRYCRKWGQAETRANSDRFDALFRKSLR